MLINNLHNGRKWMLRKSWTCFWSTASRFRASREKQMATNYSKSSKQLGTGTYKKLREMDLFSPKKRLTGASSLPPTVGCYTETDFSQRALQQKDNRQPSQQVAKWKILITYKENQSLHNDCGNALAYSVQNMTQFPFLAVFKLQWGKTLSNLS